MDQVNQNGAADLNARINNPDTAAALNRLLDRIDTLEQTVSTLTDTIQQAPGLMAMAGDVVDNTYRDAQSRGVDLEKRAAVGLQLLEKLTEPQMANHLQQLLVVVQQAPGMVAMVGDIVDNTYRGAAESGLDIESRAMTALKLISRLSEPQMAGQLQTALDLVEQAPGMAAMVGDIVDDAYSTMAASGIDIETLARQGAGAAMQLSELAGSDEFRTLMDSGVLDPKSLGVLGNAADALIASQASSPQQIGPIGLLRAMREPDVQKTLGFLMTFAKEFGKKL